MLLDALRTRLFCDVHSRGFGGEPLLMGDVRCEVDDVPSR